MPKLPPIRHPYLELKPFSWCQVAYVYARELYKQGEKWDDALGEAKTIVDALEPHGTPTPTLAGVADDMVNWPTLICAANAYASMPSGQRRVVFDMMKRSGNAAIIPIIGEGGCDRKVLDDPEYYPQPPCIPQQVASTAWLAATAFAFTAFAVWALTASTKR